MEEMTVEKLIKKRDKMKTEAEIRKEITQLTDYFLKCTKMLLHEKMDANAKTVMLGNVRDTIQKLTVLEWVLGSELRINNIPLADL